MKLYDAWNLDSCLRRNDAPGDSHSPVHSVIESVFRNPIILFVIHAQAVYIFPFFNSFMA